MTKAQLTNKIIINPSKTTVREGYLILKSSETIRVDRILCDVSLEARGQMSSTKKRITSFVLSKNRTLTKDEEYRLPFTIEISEEDTNTFTGSNVSFTYKCTVDIDINEYDLDKIDRSLFSKVKSFVTSDDSIIVSKYFDVKEEECDYEVVNAKTELTLKQSHIFFIIGVLLVGLIFVFFSDFFKGFYLLIGLFVAILLAGLIRNYISDKVGLILINIYKKDHSFQCTLDKIKQVNLTNKHLYYEIIEQVIDDRGTRSSTHEDVIYTSSKKDLKHINSEDVIPFTYPKRKGLHSVKYGDASILWRMVLSGKSYLGLTIKYTCDFRVKRVKTDSNKL